MKHPNALYHYFSRLTPRERETWIKAMTLLIDRYLMRRYGRCRPFSEDAHDVFQRTFERLAQHPELMAGREISGEELMRIFGGCIKYTIYSLFNANTVAAGTRASGPGRKLKRRRVAPLIDLDDCREDELIAHPQDRPYSSSTPETAYIMSEHVRHTLVRLRRGNYGRTARSYIDALVGGAIEAGQSTDDIAKTLGTTPQNVRKIRQRFHRFISTDDRPKPRPPS